MAATKGAVALAGFSAANSKIYIYIFVVKWGYAAPLVMLYLL